MKLKKKWSTLYEFCHHNWNDHECQEDHFVDEKWRANLKDCKMVKTLFERRWNDFQDWSLHAENNYLYRLKSKGTHCYSQFWKRSLWRYWLWYFLWLSWLHQNQWAVHQIKSHCSTKSISPSSLPGSDRWNFCQVKSTKKSLMVAD